MRLSLIILLVTLTTSAMTTTDPVSVYDFRKGVSAKAWEVQDDTVMGGKSQGKLSITDEGHAHFSGHVSLENDGGFSSIQHDLKPTVDVSEQEAFVVRLKGDGKKYTLRVNTGPENEYFFQSTFPTSGEWEEVTVPFQEMSAVHHGEPVDVPNFSGGKVHVVQFLIGNKKEQDFEVLVDRIGAK